MKERPWHRAVWKPHAGSHQSEQMEEPRVPFLPQSEGSFGMNNRTEGNTTLLKKKTKTLPNEMKVTPKWVYVLWVYAKTLRDKNHHRRTRLCHWSCPELINNEGEHSMFITDRISLPKLFEKTVGGRSVLKADFRTKNSNAFDRITKQGSRFCICL